MFPRLHLLTMGLLWAAPAESYRQSLRLEKRLEKTNGSMEETDTTNRCGDHSPLGFQMRYDKAGIASNCEACNSQNQCKWCPLNMFCQTKGTPCSKRNAAEQELIDEDYKLEKPVDCHTKEAPWRKMMIKAYGNDWEADPVQHADAKRCVQWTLDWPVDADPNMPITPASGGKDAITEEHVGQWGCRSALLREAILGSLTKSFSRAVSWRKSEMDILKSLSPHDYPQALVETGGNATSENWDTQVSKPLLCDFIHLKLPKACEVTAYGSSDFAELRKPAALPNHLGIDITNQLMEEIKSGPIVSFDPGAGKSGSGFARTWRDQFKVKLGLRSGKFRENYINEPRNLMRLVAGSGGSAIPLKDHLAWNKDSLLNRYFALVSVAISGEYAHCLVMQDATYNTMSMVKPAVKQGQWWAQAYTPYDLKGESRNQTKHSGRSTGYNADFHDKETVLFLGDNECTKFRAAVRKDTEYLKAHNLIDYSFFVGVTDRGRAQNGNYAAICEKTAGDPFCSETQTDSKSYTLSIIDYLNDKNFVKGLELKGFSWKFTNYGQEMLAYANKICRTAPEKALFQRLGAALKAHGLSPEKAFNLACKADPKCTTINGMSKEGLAQLLMHVKLNNENAAELHKQFDLDGVGGVSEAEFSYAFM